MKTQRATQRMAMWWAMRQRAELCCPNQRNTKNCWSHQRLGEGHGPDSPPEPPEGTSPANAGISDFWPQNFEGTDFCFLNSLVCGNFLQLPPIMLHTSRPQYQACQRQNDKSAGNSLKGAVAPSKPWSKWIQRYVKEKARPSSLLVESRMAEVSQH